MTADRAEWTGVGAALAFHVALIAALSTSLASIKDVAEPPSMEVELVDSAAISATWKASAAPTPVHSARSAVMACRRRPKPKRRGSTRRG